MPAARPKQTAAQAGLSARPPVPEELLRKVVMSLRLVRADSEPMWFSVCTQIANIAVANGYQDAGLRVFHDFSKKCPAKYDKTETDAKFARAVRNYNPQWGFFVPKNMLRKDNPDLLNQLSNFNKVIKAAWTDAHGTDCPDSLLLCNTTKPWRVLTLLRFHALSEQSHLAVFKGLSHTTACLWTRAKES